MKSVIHINLRVVVLHIIITCLRVEYFFFNMSVSALFLEEGQLMVEFKIKLSNVMAFIWVLLLDFSFNCYFQI